MPDVSVVVIAFNDAGRLPTAVESVLDQTLANLEVIIVDDASTDGTAQVADRFAETDPRVRVVHRQQNSGGCGLPRNAGLDLARAPYVMFLDSDDTFTRHSCKNLLVQAERTGADVVIGRCVRVDVVQGTSIFWAEKTHRPDPVVFAGVREDPGLFFDTVSTNKIYRRDFLNTHELRFPVGVYYEDQLFTTQVYCLATVIAMIPTLVYRWMVQDATKQQSITQRRHVFENFRDRIAVNRLIDAFLVEHGAADLKIEKDVKFLQHDLHLYLNDLPHRAADYQRQFMELAGDYLRTFDERSLARVDRVRRICVASIVRGDVEGTLRAIDWLTQGAKLSTELVERDGRIYWSERHLDDPRGRSLLDVTDLGLHELPFRRQSVYHEVTSFDVRGEALSLSGWSLNQLGQIGPQDPIRITIEVRAHAGKRRRRFPVDQVRHDGARISWSAQVDLRRAIGRLDGPNPLWYVVVEIDWAGEVNRSLLSAAPAFVADTCFAVRGRFRGLVNGQVEPYVTMRGNLAFQQRPDRTALMRRVGSLHRRATRWADALPRRVTSALNHPALKRPAYRLFRRLPPDPRMAVFQSQLGQQYTGNPKYVYEAARTRQDLDAVWIYARSKAGFPKEARLVRRDSWSYYWCLARAQYWVDDQGFPRQVVKRRTTVYVQTWHGTPLKRMGFDSPSLEQSSGTERAAHQAMIDRWDWLVAPSDYFIETFARSYRYSGQLLRSGSPRNDPLVRASADRTAALRSRLGVPVGRTVVLYAPTFRDRDRRLKKPFDLRLDLDLLLRELGRDLFLLIRPHYLDRLTLPRKHLRHVADVSRYPDVTELLLVADVLITDYSSVMFDYANLGRPMIFFTYDYEDYVRDERGTYLDLKAIAPGPLVTDTDGVIAALRNVGPAETEFRERYAAFRERFCAYESGRAAETVAAAVLTGRSR